MPHPRWQSNLFQLPEDDICMYTLDVVLRYIWKVLFVMYGKINGKINGKRTKVAIRQRSFLPKHCSGAGGDVGPADT